MHNSSMLTWQEAVELNIASTGHTAYRDNCDARHPNHLAWRQEMVRMASGSDPEPWQIPPDQQVMTTPQRCCGG